MAANGATVQAAKAIDSITVPKGFVFEVVAEAPLVAHPLMAALDERGRLFVADHADNNLAGDPNAIRLLEASSQDGRFDRSSLFADHLTLPTGLLWHQGALYVTATPSLWRISESRSSGRAGTRRQMITGFMSREIAADIHAQALGPDGRIYWADGAYGGFSIARPVGGELKGQDAVICRCKPDGSDFEIYCDMGARSNLGCVAATADGEIFANVIPVHHNDALAHCVEGGVCVREPLDAWRRTGPPLPGIHWGMHVAPSGLIRYRGTAFGKQYEGNLFSSQFNTHKIQRHILKRTGATYQIQTEDFLISTNPDFHPTDLLEDPDGSLLVVNTGGWFIKGCPTSRIAKPQVLGAIYRVRSVDAPTLADPSGRSINWETLSLPAALALLDDPRWMVRDRAIDHFSQLQGGAVAALRQAIEHGDSARARRNAVWASHGSVAEGPGRR